MKGGRVAVVAYSAPPLSAGGVASAHYNLFRKLKEAGFDAKLFTFGDPKSENGAHVIRRGSPSWLGSFIAKLNGIVFGLLQPGKTAYQVADIFKSLVGARAMSRQIGDYDPELVILSDHGAPGLMLKKPARAKVILVSHHNPARFGELPGYSQWDTRLAIDLEQRALAKVDAVVCPSRYMKDWFEQTYSFSGRIEVIPNLLDETYLDQIKPHDLRMQLNMAPRAPLIYLPSAGSPLKGAQFLLPLIRELIEKAKRTIGFYIAGHVQPEIIEQLKGMPEQAQICLAGQLSYEGNIANVKACSFGISPSTMENYSMALLEAVHCGVPMLVFDTGGNRDIICDGENGFLVPKGDVKKLIDHATALLEPLPLNALREKTLTYSKKNLSSELALQKYIDVMGSL